MSGAEYHFISEWRLPNATIDEVASILADPLDLPRWWPSVYLAVKELRAGDARGVGRQVDLYTTGWLPYTLRWRFTVVENDPPQRIALDASGDFVGRGVWSFRQDGAAAVAIYDWRITATKPLLARLSWLLRPLFSANHRWAMARGEESMRIELERLSLLAANRAGAYRSPPGPTATRSLIAPGIAIGAALATVILLRRRR